MKAKIQRWGNSLGLRIPKSFATEADIDAGSTVDLSVKEGELIVRPLKPRRYRLTDLLEGVTEDNLHGEIGTGDATGREAW